MDACQEMLDAHLQEDGTFCECVLCLHAQGTLYNATQAEACFDSELLAFPASIDRRSAADEAQGDTKGADLWRLIKQDLEAKQAAAVAVVDDSAKAKPRPASPAAKEVNPFYVRPNR